MITLSDISFRYSGTKRNVFENFSLSLENNAIYGLLGKNGEGKSTLLYIITGLLLQQKGKVEVDGMTPQDRRPEFLSEIFILSEDFSLPKVQLSEYLAINKVFYPNFSEDLFRECLADFGIDSNPNLSQMSMGQKKKVYISFALATQTRYLFMDEPTNGLDIPSKAQFRKVMARSMNDDRTFIISTHQVHDVDTLLDHVLILDHQKVVLNKTVEEICDEYVFEFRTPDDMDDAIYAEPSLQGNAVMAPRGNRQETQLNLELLFNAMTMNKENRK